MNVGTDKVEFELNRSMDKPTLREVCNRVNIMSYIGKKVFEKVYDVD